MSPARKLSDQRLFTLLMLSTHFVLLVFGAQTSRLSSGIVVGSIHGSISFRFIMVEAEPRFNFLVLKFLCGCRALVARALLETPQMIDWYLVFKAFCGLVELSSC